MKPWTIAEVRKLKEEVSKGKDGDLYRLSKEMKRPISSMRAQINRYRMRALKMQTHSKPGFMCGVCGSESSWDDLPSDDPVKLVTALYTWKQTHLACKRG